MKRFHISFFEDSVLFIPKRQNTISYAVVVLTDILFCINTKYIYHVAFSKLSVLSRPYMKCSHM